ncbi:SHOCT domain-containing protein [Streptacidiphilus fuscans]|uniref:SHOCT domain-containing protein n=1 Tax=Streptacidiphilus fuscans TaxID=2789292 RepID=A0A931B4S3_9ACTN|nr:SHOCT domain-containing protein [Streptacidiphilus fuscans]MBF9066900.1 SHOCT domain-containing protein [Streptacidiphilus fuscans]
MLRRGPVGGRRGPGLIGAAARTAVVAGTATAVSGNVQRRQAARAQEAAPEPVAPAAPAPAPAAPAGDDSLDRLERLAALHNSGVLTDEEFAQEKRKILGG